jgi:hypothetical protein
MSATLVVTLVDAAVGLLEKLIPSLKTAFSSGEISVADQQALKDRINKLRSSEAFTGPEWNVE